MRLLASDYDDTFYLSDEGIKNNILKVKEFMKNNIFVIATGRSYQEFIKKDKIYHIPYNYLIINHGTTILKNNKIIYSKYIDENILKDLINDLKVDKCEYYSFSSESDFDTNVLPNKTNKIRIKYFDKRFAKSMNDLVNEKYSDYVKCYYVSKGYALEIVNRVVDKSTAIEFIRNLEGINKSDVFAVGDGVTDRGMLTLFNGYKMKNSVYEIKDLEVSEIDSVSELIDMILK